MFFEQNYKYHLYILFKNNINSYLKLQLANKLGKMLKKFNNDFATNSILFSKIIKEST